MMMMQKSAVSSRCGACAPRRQALVSIRPTVSMRGLLSDKEGPDSKLSAEDQKKVEKMTGSDVTPTSANMRADLGASYTNASELQAFDGPAPETINSRLAMLGVVSALVFEAVTGQGIKEQIADHPFIVIGTFVLFAFASYVPITKGFTRKEAFSNGVWNPKAENWNGRIAMMGFLGMVITEAVSGVNTLQAWGLDKLFR